MDTKDTPTLDLGSFDFTPDWARKEAGVSAGRFTPDRDDKRTERRDDAHGPRKPFGERRPFGGGRDGSQGGERRTGAGTASKRPYSRGPLGERPQPMRPLDVDIKILPETKALGTIMRKLQQSAQAYKLKDLAYFLLDNPETVLLKITPKAPTGRLGAIAPTSQTPQTTFHQCKACSFASTRREDVVAHAVAAHLGDYYEAKEIEVEPPKGNFSCVAKCGLTGVLLGPPNVHEFNSVVREMIRTKFPGMSEADYRAKIEMVRDADAVEEWRKGATKRTVFVAKGAGEDAPQLTREQAEGEFRRSILENLLTEPKSLMLTADAALKSQVKPLVWAVRDALQLERRAPYNMIFALRGAFHHRKMKFFRANDARGPEFVVGHELKAFDAEHAIPELATVAAFVAANPCATKAEILAADAEAEKQLAWLVSTGHVVSFTNGVFSAVEKYPKYGPQWRRRAKRDGEGVGSREQGLGSGDEGRGEPGDVKTEADPSAPAPVAEVAAPVEETPPAAPVAEEAAPVVEEPPAPVEEPVEKKEEPNNESAAELAE